MQGYIKLHRQLLDWEWYSDINVRLLFLHCLLLANHDTKKWQGKEVKAGQFITSLEHLAIGSGLTLQQVRTAIKKLKSTCEITSKTTSQYSMITINNWNKWQTDNIQNNKRITNEQQTNNKRITTNKNDKNDKNDKNISFIAKNEKIPDQFINPTKDTFIKEYKKVFDTLPYLSRKDNEKLVELSCDHENIEELIPIALAMLKKITFKDINYKPTASWLLKDNNFEKVMNGEFADTKDILEGVIIRE